MRAALLLALLPATSFAETLDFEGLYCAGGSFLRIDDVTGDPYLYEEDGYVFTEVSANYGFNRFCDGSSQYGDVGNTSMYNNTPAGITRLERADGAPFAMDSINLSELNGGTVASVTFTGTTSAGATVTTTFTIDGIAFAEETFAFPGDFTDLVKVEWTQDSPYHRFNDIEVSSGGASPTISAYGSCPGGGSAVVQIFGATPGATVAVARSTSLGSFTIPGGGCAGTPLGLSSPSLIGFYTADGSGTVVLTPPSLPPGACGTNLQAVDLSACATTNVTQLIALP